MSDQPAFIPLSRSEARRLGIGSFDIIIVSGDAYVDHPSFAAALIARMLWEEGYSVGIIAQPDWTRPDDFTGLGKPRLFFAISAGNVDSMVSHYTARKRLRSTDAYSPGGKRKRPDRASLVYADRLHSLFPDTPLILGGIEASLRRFAHYDYWSDRVRQSLLADAPADLLVFGMGERPLPAIAERLSSGEPIRGIRDVPGTVVKRGVHAREEEDFSDAVVIPSFTDVATDRVAYARACAGIHAEQDPVRGRRIVQPHPKTLVVQNRPALPLTTEELDRVYELPFTRQAHPSYRESVPALEPVRFSVVSHRGCFGNCSFCALSHHQGAIIQSRSIPSLVREVQRMAKMPGFRGIVQDVGGPTANMYGMSCPRWQTHGTCPDKHCSPDCPGLVTSHGSQVALLAALREIPGVKRVFVSSGIRYDLIGEEDGEYLRELCAHHVSGHLKVAPEHITPRVTTLMGKPAGTAFEAFRKRFEEIQAGKEKRQYLVPYFMSGHPGCTIDDMVELAEYIRDTHLYTEQVQDFTPTPMTTSTCMFHTGINPLTMEQVHVPKDHEKEIQRAMLHYRDPANRTLIEEGLRLAGRTDLVGNSGKCLVRPEKKRKK
ncbi:fe-s oxidoreductase [hydrocarbon metagenome]|uniref:Fe-s oxidoreductase n=1 Tax=hydrocarbon metagenome TaxID=938273 RepID=A0A0W8F2U9_9ZZZZ